MAIMSSKDKTKPVVLELKDVTVELGGKVIFKNVSLKIYDEESIVLIGPSGHGKTVLLKTMAGVFKPTHGHVYVDGEDWQNLQTQGKHDLARKLGMLFQESALFDAMTVLENVVFPMREHGLYNEEERHKIAKHLLERTHLDQHADKLPHELSGGMQRRLGIARALALNPKIVFYDDPVAGQDPVQSDEMADLILNLKKENKSTMVTVTSSMEIAFKIADRIFMVVNEEVLDVGSPAETQKNPDARVQQFIHGRTEGPIQVRR
jgi:phospholipid/cholesterol/gamma-HCH transport system ATP-binding protein